MNVLFVSRGYPRQHNNTLGIFELDQAIAMKNAGNRIAIATIDIRSIRRKRKLGYNYFIDENGIEIFEMNWPIGGIPIDLANFFREKCFEKLYSHIETIFGKPDIIHAHFLNIGFAVKEVCKREKIPLVLTEHSSIVNNDDLPRVVIRRAKKTYGACDAIIAVSYSLADKIRINTGFESTVIHNIVRIGNTKLNDSASSDNKEIKFVSAGNLIHGKGFDILLYAFAKAIKSEPNLVLEIYGDGPERNKLKALTEELGIEKKVNFKGRYKKEDLYKLYSDATSFVLASRAETFGVVYIEAMALGLPVIATKCGGPEDFVNESNGYLVDIENVDDLSNALIKMALNHDSFNRQQIHEYAFSHFSETKIANQVAEVYKSVLIKKGSSNRAE